MSETKIKIGIRFELRHLRNAPIEDVYKYFKIRDIIPTYYYPDTLELYYDPSKCGCASGIQQQPMIKMGDKMVSSVHMYYTVVSDYADEYFDFEMKLDDTLTVIDRLRREHVIRNEDIKLFGYMWYNGVDEPFYLE